ncbi:MAG: NAD-dependent epimerase/dehydratase family protein [Gammaproteobacteria bacterium]|nr:NAD-dependent epimerase/dehydratase family protein [Gammaproteobacteria bacterium]MBU1446710.1 NAD-dependent epimerase/dehydratase family protein [Gammaproteobacteria bacterium]
MKILVLGGCGFIGSHLVDGLLAAGHKVRVFDRAPELYRQLLTNVDYRFGDFSDVPSLAEALEGIEVVYHLISTTVPSTSNLDPVADVQGNLLNTLRLLQLMVGKNIHKIVFLSSGGTVYGIPDTVPIPETHPLRPICSYGVVKVAVENYLQMFHQLHGLEYVVLRASNPYGERQGHAGVQGVIGTFMQKMLAGEQIEIWGDGSVIRDFIYVGDLARLCVLAGQSEVTGTYNAGQGVGYSINEAVGMLSKVAGQAIEPTYRAGRGFDVPSVVLDISQACQAFEWQPSSNLECGLAATWRWMKP